MVRCWCAIWLNPLLWCTERTLRHSLERQRTLSPLLSQGAETQDQSFLFHERLLLWLRQTLRRWPRWVHGHLRFAREALEAKNVGAAYAGALAVRALSRSPDSRVAADLVLAKCYLRSGLSAKAQGLLEALHQERPNESEISEELAAVYMLSDRRVDALRLLESIPSSALCSESRMALEYLRSSGSGEG